MIYNRSGNQLQRCLLGKFLVPFLTGVFFFYPPSLNAQSKPVNILFGDHNRLEYLPGSGLVNLYQGKLKIISNGYAEVRANGQVYKSTSYQQVTYTSKRFADKLGTGVKHVFELHTANAPVMLQVFYTYDRLNYFFAEVMIIGKKLSTNDMAVLVSDAADIYSNKDVRTLFAPFDNDTFISYNARPMSSAVNNTSAEVGVVYDNTSRKGLVIGSVEQNIWKTGVQTTGKTGQLNNLRVWSGFSDPAITRDSIPHGYISGDSIRSAKVLIGYFNDWRTGLETYGRAVRIFQHTYVFNWTKPTPVGWNSWGAMQENINYEKAVAVADFFGDSVRGFRNGNEVFIDLDSYWDKLAINGIEGDLSQLKAFAEHCKSKGMMPGIYWAPFADWGWNRSGSANRKVEGSARYTYGDAWTKTGGYYHNIDGARALDPTHPATRQRIALYMSKFKACGFNMIKVDFLGHGAIESDKFYDSTVTTGMQAYKSGMEYLIDQAGSELFMYAAISPSVATGRYMHARRIACDAFKSINDTRYTLNSINYGWWQTFVYNYIDADHIVFGEESEGANKARLTSGLIAGTLFAGDDFSVEGAWKNKAKKWLQDKELLAIVKNGKAFMPLDGNSADSANPVYLRTIGTYLYVAVFNLENQQKTYTLNVEKLGLLSSKIYEAEELYSKHSQKIKTVLTFNATGVDAAIYKIRL